MTKRRARPVSSLPACSTASNAPRPELPAAVKITSAPLLICASAISLPLPGLFHALSRDADVVVYHAHVRIDGLRALLVAGLEAVDEADVHPAEEAEHARLRRPRRDHADEVRALVLLEDERGDVRQLARAVHDGEVDVRVVLRHLLHDGGLREADADDEVVVALGEGAHRGLDGGRVAGLHVAQHDGKIFRGAHHALPRRRVEGAVVLAADVEDDADVNLILRLGGAPLVHARRPRKGERTHQNRRD